MPIIFLIMSFIISVTNVTITEPLDGETYNGDWLPLRVIVENDNEVPDFVHYTLNGGPVTLIDRLNTDWPTYMQSYLHHGFSESPAPIDNTILWTAPVTGDFHEFPTPVVVNGIVYYAQDHGGDSLYALDSATGDLIWKYRVGTNDDAVTVQAGRLYAASDSIFCLDAVTGEKIWVSADADWLGGTPVVTDGRVFCGTGPTYGSGQLNISYISCLDSSDGANLWTAQLDSCALYSCMTVWNQFVFVPTWRDDDVTSLYALDRETGDVLWENDDSFTGYWDSSPVLVDSVLYINGCDGYSRAIDAMFGNAVWSTYFHPATATSAYHDGRLYFASEYYNLYHCVDAIAGIHVWGTSGRQHGSSAIADGMVFYGEINGGDPGGIRVLDCETGAEVWSYYAAGTEWIAGSPSITDGVVYMPMHDNNLYAFGTGLKYTYKEDYFYAEVGSNELIVTSWDDGVAVAADTISFTVTGTGFNLDPSRVFKLAVSPNPFTSVSSITFEIPEDGAVSIEIFDITGRMMRSLVDSQLYAGSHSLQWDGRSQSGEEVATGLYFCRIKSGGAVESAGMCLLR